MHLLKHVFRDSGIADHRGGIMNIPIALFNRLSPTGQDAIFRLLLTVNIPIFWTGAILLGYYVSITFPLALVYIAVALVVYILMQYSVLYPSHQRVQLYKEDVLKMQSKGKGKGKMESRTKTKTKEDEDDKEGERERDKEQEGQEQTATETESNESNPGNHTNESNMRKSKQKFSVGASGKNKNNGEMDMTALPKMLRLDRVLIWLGMVADPFPAAKLTADEQVNARFWHRQWSMYIANENFSGTGDTSSSTNTSSSKNKNDKNKNSIVKVKSKLPSDFHKLDSFADNWEDKWNIERDHMHKNELQLREQYIGGDYSNLLHLHIEKTAAVGINNNVIKSIKSPRNYRKFDYFDYFDFWRKPHISTYADAKKLANSLFEEFGGKYTVASTGKMAGTDTLSYAHLLEVSYKVFLEYAIDDQYLSEKEWVEMANELKKTTLIHKDECLTYSEYAHWLKDIGKYDL